MSRKSSRLHSSSADPILGEPRLALTKVTRVYKRPKKMQDDRRNNEEDKENNISLCNNVVVIAGEDGPQKKDQAISKKQTQKDTSKTDEIKQDKLKIKKDTKRESLGKTKKTVKSTQDTTQDIQLSDFLKQQEAFFKSVDKFELTVVEEQPQDMYRQTQHTVQAQRSNSPFLKDLIKQEFKRKEQERMAYNQQWEQEENREGLDDSISMGYLDDYSFCAPPIPVQEARVDENPLFADADYENLEEELDAELFYLKAPKHPLPLPFFPSVMRCVDPTESDFLATPAPTSSTNTPYAYDEYKMVIGPVGTPMSFEDFMAMQKQTL